MQYIFEKEGIHLSKQWQDVCHTNSRVFMGLGQLYPEFPMSVKSLQFHYVPIKYPVDGYNLIYCIFLYWSSKLILSTISLCKWALHDIEADPKKPDYGQALRCAHL